MLSILQICRKNKERHVIEKKKTLIEMIEGRIENILHVLIRKTTK